MHYKACHNQSKMTKKQEKLAILSHVEFIFLSITHKNEEKMTNYS